MSRIAADELVLRYLDGAATPDEVTAIEARLRDDPEARRAFVRMAHLHALASELAHAPLVEAPPQHRWGWIAGTVAAAAALVVGIWSSVAPQRERGPMLSRCEGTVACRRDGGELPIATGTRLLPGDSLRVTGDGRVELAWGDGAVVTADTHGDLIIGEATGTRLRLARGTISALVAHDPARAFAVATPEATITDVGTRFTVARDGASTRVSVAQGEVAVAASASALEVHAGEKAVVAAGGAARLVRLHVQASLPASPEQWRAPLPQPVQLTPLPESLSSPDAWRVEAAKHLPLPAGAELRAIGRRGKIGETLGEAPLPDLRGFADAIPQGLDQLILLDAAAGRAWELSEPELSRGTILARELRELPIDQVHVLPLFGGVLFQRNLHGEGAHALAVALPHELLDGKRLRIGSRLAVATGSGGGALGALLASHGAWVLGVEAKATLFIEPRLAHDNGAREGLEHALHEVAPAIRLVEDEVDDEPRDGGF
jgi:hypothetical protein